MEKKSLPLELKDLDKGKRIAIIAHAAYNNVDRTKDVSRKGMFKKSWQENKDDISFYLNHNDEQSPGSVTDVYDDDDFAYTQVKMGTHTLGNDVMLMLEEKTIRNSSFGYVTIKSNPILIKGEKIRELKEVAHLETSVLTKLPANPKSGIVKVVKSLTSPDMLAELKGHMANLEKFCRNSKASDECIQNLLAEIKSLNNLVSQIDTEDTQDVEPTSSDGDGEEMTAEDAQEAEALLQLLNLKLSMS